MISNAGRIVSAGRVRGARHHAVGLARVHHQRAEVRHVGHRLERELLGHALVLAQLVVAAGVALAQRRRSAGSTMRAPPTGRDRARPRAPRTSSGSPRIVRLDDPAPQQDVGGAQHAVVVALGQHDVLRARLRALDQLVLEHDRRQPRGPLEADLLLELAAGRRRDSNAPSAARDLALVVGADHRPHRLDHGRGRVGALGDLEDRERRVLEQPSDRRVQLVAAR